MAITPLSQSTEEPKQFNFSEGSATKDGNLSVTVVCKHCTVHNGHISRALTCTRRLLHAATHFTAWFKANMAQGLTELRLRVKLKSVSEKNSFVVTAICNHRLLERTRSCATQTHCTGAPLSTSATTRLPSEIAVIRQRTPAFEERLAI